MMTYIKKLNMFQTLYFTVFYSMLLLITVCEIGTFGKGCSYRCRGHCLNNVPCDSTTGHCESGCAPGYAEPFRNKSMNLPVFCNALRNKLNV